jgi:hypothetical protein
MQTYSHFIITLWLNRKARDAQVAAEAAGKPSRLPPLHSQALLWGSVAPDLPLIAITLGMAAADLLTGTRWEPGAAGATSRVGYLFNHLFFHDPWVKAAHNLFHAPLMVAAYLTVGYWAWRDGRRWGAGLFWFGLACALHTAIDIPLHYDDGPLLLFPLEWSIRFYSPVSYWDPARYGTQFAIGEHLLVLGLLFRMAVDGRRRRRARQGKG